MPLIVFVSIYFFLLFTRAYLVVSLRAIKLARK
jgi:hypothetical membrane protein